LTFDGINGLNLGEPIAFNSLAEVLESAPASGNRQIAKSLSRLRV
jgi:hypothetical protein